MANIITVIRIICSLGLLFCYPFSVFFYILYLIAGISDMLDGMVARSTNTSSEFGAKLDTLADSAFIIVCMLKMIPVLNLENWMFIWMIIIGIIKIINIISGYVMWHMFVTVHSMMNKITGFILFIFPFTIMFFDMNTNITVLLVIATFAAIHEGHYIRTNVNNVCCNQKT